MNFNFICNLKPMWRKCVAVELVKGANIKASLGSSLLLVKNNSNP